MPHPAPHHSGNGSSQPLALFRPEALAAKRGEWLGTIQLATPLSGWVLSAVAIALAVALLAFLTFGHYTRRERVTGQLVPVGGLLSIGSPNGGTVAKVLVHEGQVVHRGDALVEVSGELDSAALGGTRALVSAQLRVQRTRLEADLDDQRHLADEQAQGLRTRIVSLRDQAAQVDAQLALQRKQTDSAQQLFDKIEPLRDKGYVSAIQIQQEEANLLADRSQLKALQRQRLDAEQQIEDAKQQLAQNPLTLAAKQNDTHRALAEIDQQLAQNEAQRAIVLHAPADATVSTLPVDVGQTVAVGQTLMTLLPQGSSRQAQLLVPSSGVGFVRAGDRVVLRYRAYPYQKFGQHYGSVAEVSRSALTPSEVSAITGQAATEPLYRVAVKLYAPNVLAYGKTEPLKAGMALDADILQERRSLIEWVLEPLYGLGQRVASGGDSA
jgi:membrane fusion protein